MALVREIGFTALLDAIEGVAYVVEPSGQILACGSRNWDAFAQANGSASFVSSAVVGHDLFDYVKGKDVRCTYDYCLKALSSGRHRSFEIPFRCDAPELRREMRLSIRPIVVDDTMIAVLFQSLLTSETIRPPIDLFDTNAVIANITNDRRPIVSMCSFCHAVRSLAEQEEKRPWMSAESYYRYGGSSDVRISHGVCPACSYKLEAYFDQAGNA